MLSAHFMARALKADEADRDEHEDEIERSALEVDKILRFFVAPEKDNSKRLIRIEVIFSRGRDIGKLMFASPSRWKFDWKPSRNTIEQDLQQERHAKRLEEHDLEQQERYARRPKEDLKHRKTDSKGRSQILICFPGLEQHTTQNLDDHDGLGTKRRRGEYLDGPEIRRALEPARRPTSELIEDTNIHPVESTGSLSTSSKGALHPQISDEE
jgi:hypothetical protein